MNSKHTPGPWETTNSWHRYCHDREPDDDMMSYHSSIMAEAPFTENESGGFEECDKQSVASANGRTEEEMRANARLIAAAPDLLAAAKKAFREIDRGLHGEVGGYDPIGTAKALREAIAKAEGK